MGIIAYEKQSDGSLKKVEKSLWNKKFKQEVEIWCENDGELIYNLCTNLGGYFSMDRCHLGKKEVEFGDVGHEVTLKEWCHNNDMWIDVRYRVPKDNDFFYKDGEPNPMIWEEHTEDDIDMMIGKLAKGTLGVVEKNIRDFFDLPKSAKFITDGEDFDGLTFIPKTAYEVFSRFRVRLPPIKSERGQKQWEVRLKKGLNILSDVF